MHKNSNSSFLERETSRADLSYFWEWQPQNHGIFKIYDMECGAYENGEKEVIQQLTCKFSQLTVFFNS